MEKKNVMTERFCCLISLGPLVSSINKTDRHGITEVLLKVALNIIKPNQTILHT
jgi:hypothetical protein